MGRRISVLCTAVILLVILFTVNSYGNGDNTSADKQRITVREKVPEFTIYCEEYGNANTKSDLNIEMTSGQEEIITEIRNVRLFNTSESNEGITYFLLIDTSVSMNRYADETFESIKKAVIDFTESRMDSKDKVFLIPFDVKAEYDDKGMNPTTSDLKDKIKALEADGSRSNIYDALGETVKLAEKIKNDYQYPDRKVAILFTDAWEFNDGGDEATASDIELVSSGVTLHAFTIGDRKEDKNKLRELVLRSGGTIFDENPAADLNRMQDVLDRTLVVEIVIKNVSDIKGNYNVKVYNENLLIGMKSGIPAPNTSGVKDAFSVTVKKIILKYWWVVFIIAIALIATAVLVVIKRNKGIVNVDGKIVYGNNVKKKYHVKNDKKATAELMLRVSVKGNRTVPIEYSLIGSMIVGRASACDLYFDDEKMSRQHFVIEIIEGKLYISDLESTSGTYLNGVKVYMNQQLNSGDIVTAGTTKIAIDWNV